jgi:hypothetical protein
MRYFEFLNEAVEGNDPQYPVAVEDWGDMEVSNGNDYVEIKNMQINNVGHNGEFATFVNCQFDLEYEPGDHSVGVGKGFIASIEDRTVDIQGIMDENGDETDAHRIPPAELDEIHKQVVNVLQRSEDQVAEYADEQN